MKAKREGKNKSTVNANEQWVVVSFTCRCHEGVLLIQMAEESCTCRCDEGVLLIQMVEEGFTCCCDEGVDLIQKMEEGFYLHVVSMKM